MKKVEIRKIRENGKIQVQQKLKQFFMSLKTELEKERNELADKKLSLQKTISAKQQEKENKTKELAALRNQELESVMNKVKGERELAELNELQKRMKNELAEKNQMEQTEEVMVMNEFKAEDNDDKSKLENEINVEELVAELSKELDIENKLAQINENDYKVLGSKVSLAELTEALLQYANKSKSDPNLVLAKLDVIVTTLVMGKLSEKIMQAEKASGKNDENAKMFKIKHIFENLKKEPSTHLDFYFEYLSTKFFENQENWNELWAKRKTQFDTPLDCLNFVEKCSLNSRYKHAQVEAKKTAKVSQNFYNE